MRNPSRWHKTKSIPSILLCRYCFSAAALAAEGKASPPGPEYGGETMDYRVMSKSKTSWMH